jgi:hypothetical protein
MYLILLGEQLRHGGTSSARDFGQLPVEMRAMPSWMKALLAVVVAILPGGLLLLLAYAGLAALFPRLSDGRRA